MQKQGFFQVSPHRARALVLQQYHAQGTSSNLLGLLVETFLTPNLCGEKPTTAVSFMCHSVMHVKTKIVVFLFPH